MNKAINFSNVNSIYEYLYSNIITKLDVLNFNNEQKDKIKVMLKSCSVYLTSFSSKMTDDGLVYVDSYNRNQCLDIIDNISTICCMDLPLLTKGGNSYFDSIYSFLDDRIKHYSSSSYSENVITNFAIGYLSNVSLENIQEQWEKFFNSFLLMQKYSDLYNSIVSNLEKYFLVEIDQEKKAYDKDKSKISLTYDNDIMNTKIKLANRAKDIDESLPEFLCSINAIDCLYAKFVQICIEFEKNGLSMYDDNFINEALFNEFLKDLDNLERLYDSINYKLVNYTNMMNRKPSLYGRFFGRKFIKDLLRDDLSSIDSIKNKYEMLSLENNMYLVSKIVLDYSAESYDISFDDMMDVIAEEYEKLGLLFDLTDEEYKDLENKYNSKRYSI